jgi:D-arabinose 1-dehydrogenase-like Zn-dependent alcohol dehydrogenase
MLIMCGRSSGFFWDCYEFHGSLVASRAVHDEMLEFSARHGIKPKLELYEHKGAETITQIIERLEANKVRYRAVLVNKQ